MSWIWKYLPWFLVVAVTLVYLGHLGYDVGWTGFGQSKKTDALTIPEKNLWDWLGLFLVPAALAGFGVWFNQRQRMIDRQRIEAEQKRGEEQKIIEETKKILDAPDLGVVPTAVRVPVHVGHALSVNMETTEQLRLDQIQKLWRNAPGVIFDDGFPTPRDIAGRDEVFVARLRGDPTRPTAASFWVVGDNLRKGAATNSVQIAELWQVV